MAEQDGELAIGGKWILAGKAFEPVAESLQDVVGYTNPTDKRVLAVASYGGFPLAFLAEGAKYVLSFDVDAGRIGWNHFLRASTSALNYRENLAFFQHQPDALKPQDIRDRVELLLPVDYAQEAFNRMIIFHLCYPHFANRVTTLYPHLRDEQTYQRVKDTVSRGGWEIRQEECLTLLRGEALSGKEGFDVMYISSIRNWVLDIRYQGDVEKFETDYDGELGKLVTGLLNERGIFYEALIFADGFPKVRIPPRLYPGLDIQEYPSYDLDSNTKIVVGTKVAQV